MSAPLLLVDAGNTLTKWATVADSSLILPQGATSTKQATAVDVRALAKQFPDHNAILSSVVPRLVSYFQDAFHDRLHLVTTDSPALGLLFNYSNPSEIGADRLAAATAVREDGLSPAIIVQCGTATAFSVLDSDGRFTGGVIAPGPLAQLTALVGITAQLPQINLHVPTESLGKSTEEAVRIGIALNYRGGVNEILRELCRDDKPPLTSIILTGGNTQFLTGSLEFPFTLRPLLVFEGLRIIGLRAFKDV